MRYILSFFSSVTVGVSTLFGDLAQNESYQEGMSSLSVYMPDVAVNKFKEALAGTDLTEEERNTLSLRLAEAQIRSFDGVGAEKTLSADFLAKHPDQPFWLAHAYFAQGRHRDAALLFEVVVEDGSELRRGEALLALSELYRSLKEPEKAFMVLEKATQSQKLSDAANLKLVELYIEKEQLAQAEELLLKLEPKKQGSQALKKFLQAKILLEKKNGEQARELLVALQDSEQVSQELQNVVSLSVVDSYILEGELEEASDRLLQMVTKNPQSPYMHLIFNRLYNTVQAGVKTEVLEQKLKEWIEKINPFEKGETEAPVESPQFKYPERDAFSRFLLASIIGKSEADESLEEANELLNTLRDLHSGQVVARISYIPTAQNFLRLGKKEEALKILKQMGENAFTAPMKARAATSRSLIMEQEGDHKGAIEELHSIALLEHAESTENAQVNISLMRIMQGDEEAFRKASKLVLNPSLEVGLAYEWTLQQMQLGEIETRAKMVHLLKQSPSHAVANQARVELINHCIFYQPMDIKLALSLLENLDLDKLKASERKRAEVLSARVKLLGREWESLIKDYTVQIAGLKEEDRASMKVQKLQLSLAEAYFRNGEFINARKEFNAIVQIETSPFKEHAYFFSALAATKEGTPQGKQEGRKLLEKVVELEGDYQFEAILQLARIKIDMQELNEALVLLESKSGKKDFSDKEDFERWLLLADVYVRMGGEQDGEKALLKKAEELYEKLIGLKQGQAAWVNRLYYLKGQAQEGLEEDKKASLETYFDIVHLSYHKDKKQPLEWEWYYKAGLRATNILEQQERWKAAVSLLEKMADYYGPKSDILLERASKLKLKHHIW